MTLEDVTRDGIDDGFRQVVAQLTKNLIDGSMAVSRFSLALTDAINRRGQAIAASEKLTGVK